MRNPKRNKARSVTSKRTTHLCVARRLVGLLTCTRQGFMLSVGGIDLSLGQLLVIPEGSNLRGIPCGCKLLLEQPRVDLGVLGCKVSGSCAGQKKNARQKKPAPNLASCKRRTENKGIRENVWQGQCSRVSTRTHRMMSSLPARLSCRAARAPAWSEFGYYDEKKERGARGEHDHPCGSLTLTTRRRAARIARGTRKSRPAGTWGVSFPHLTTTRFEREFAFHPLSKLAFLLLASCRVLPRFSQRSVH